VDPPAQPPRPGPARSRRDAPPISPVSVVLTCPRSDVEIDGYQLAAGQQRVIFPAGANRDPTVFPDPDTFDIARNPNPHLAFSAGAHFCLGAPLARLHGQVAIPVLLDRLPDLHLAGTPEWLGSNTAPGARAPPHRLAETPANESVTSPARRNTTS